MELCKFGFKLANNETPEPLKVLMESRGGEKTHKYIPEVSIYLIFTSITRSNTTPAFCVKAWLNTQSY